MVCSNYSSKPVHSSGSSRSSRSNRMHAYLYGKHFLFVLPYVTTTTFVQDGCTSLKLYGSYLRQSTLDYMIIMNCLINTVFSHLIIYHAFQQGDFFRVTYRKGYSPVIALLTRKTFQMVNIIPRPHDHLKGGYDLWAGGTVARAPKQSQIVSLA